MPEHRVPRVQRVQQVQGVLVQRVLLVQAVLRVRGSGSQGDVIDAEVVDDK